ncbi:hypothetical protein DICPUDRAFT_80813 [Dictyostelium purpureum]|uniref:Homeobox domain-containing protein n=1 Tax=Dictyostelium purpureum TaxID=5786 RepID=F0ZRL7_DICPU|nr:uncharacterized protein DICPUDRAFT_80813 [Dictyostelium purpureum]EGC33404.1 hypothetical protein DICPUDRAFT_80813 [Dictyostelium purpureum]|eukprot:XP_003290068.1 hypothetical protein DICPUDRAFT_80813 [Dictyostelium purpureum]
MVKNKAYNTATINALNAISAPDAIFGIIDLNDVNSEYVVDPKLKSKITKAILEYCFDKNPFPDSIEKEIIACQLEMNVSQVVTWFKHKRENLRKSNNTSYKDSYVSKFSRNTNELNFFFHNYPFPAEENIAYFALIYGVTKEKIKIWFKSKRNSKKTTHIFIGNGIVDKSSYNPSRHLGNFYHFYEHEYDVNTDTVPEGEYKPKRIKTFDNGVYSITNISESKKRDLLIQRRKRDQKTLELNEKTNQDDTATTTAATTTTTTTTAATKKIATQNPIQSNDNVCFFNNNNVNIYNNNNNDINNSNNNNNNKHITVLEDFVGFRSYNRAAPFNHLSNQNNIFNNNIGNNSINSINNNNNCNYSFNNTTHNINNMNMKMNNSYNYTYNPNFNSYSNYYKTNIDTTNMTKLSNDVNLNINRNIVFDTIPDNNINNGVISYNYNMNNNNNMNNNMNNNNNNNMNNNNMNNNMNNNNMNNNTSNNIDNSNKKLLISFLVNNK